MGGTVMCSGQAPIAKLPNEILGQIFGNLVDSKAPYRSAWPLALTCKKFYHVAQPLVWSSLTLRPDDSSGFNPPWARPEEVAANTSAKTQSQKIRRSLESSPALKAHTKHVSVLGSIPIGFSDAIPVIKVFPNLRRLRLDGVQESEVVESHRVTMEAPEEALPPPGQEGSAGFEELQLTSFNRANPEALHNFLRWPAALRAFSLDDLAMEGYDWDFLLTCTNDFRWTYALVATVLSRHRNTLRHLRIGEIGPERLAGFDVNSFTSLETLQLCYASFPLPSEACDSWALLTLRRLIVECSYFDSQHGVVPHFTRRTAQWLTEFAELAVARRQAGSAVLAEIEVLYFDHEYIGHSIETGRLIAKTGRQITELGLTFIYSDYDRVWGQ